MVALLLYLEREGEAFTPAEDEGEEGPAWWHLAGLARAVARRKLVDRYREESRGSFVPLGGNDQVEATQENAVYLNGTLAWVAQSMETLGDGDVELVLRSAMPRPDGPLSPAERQRLTRARKTIASALVPDLGGTAWKTS